MARRDSAQPNIGISPNDDSSLERLAREEEHDGGMGSTRADAADKAQHVRVNHDSALALPLGGAEVAH
eukprot:8689760-Heterocapsa_arctica.AAC.1